MTELQNCAASYCSCDHLGEVSLLASGTLTTWADMYVFMYFTFSLYSHLVFFPHRFSSFRRPQDRIPSRRPDMCGYRWTSLIRHARFDAWQRCNLSACGFA